MGFKKSFTLTELMIGTVIFLFFVLTITGLMFFGQNSLLRNNNFIDSLQNTRSGIDRLVKELKISRFEKVRISDEIGIGQDKSSGSVINFQIPINDPQGALDVLSGEIVWGDGDISGRWISYYLENKVLRRQVNDFTSGLSEDPVNVAQNIENILFSDDSNGNDLIKIDILTTDGLSRAFIVSPKN